jgi:2,3-bisphosphoglycerate-dependent phosphoglycerate mutase
MTTVYFIRHAESDASVSDGRVRPLTRRGWESRALVTEFLGDKQIGAVLSSPFRRAVDTVSGFAGQYGFDITLIEDFREQKSSSDMRWGHPDFHACLERQWLDFGYAYSDGEPLGEVQRRNIRALNAVLAEHPGKILAIGTHGTALSTIINYYDSAYGFRDFEEMEHKLPWAVKMVFDGLRCVEIEKIDLY